MMNCPRCRHRLAPGVRCACLPTVPLFSFPPELVERMRRVEERVRSRFEAGLSPFRTAMTTPSRLAPEGSMTLERLRELMAVAQAQRPPLSRFFEACGFQEVSWPLTPRRMSVDDELDRFESNAYRYAAMMPLAVMAPRGFLFNIDPGEPTRQLPSITAEVRIEATPEYHRIVALYRAKPTDPRRLKRVIRRLLAEVARQGNG